MTVYEPLQNTEWLELHFYKKWVGGWNVFVGIAPIDVQKDSSQLVYENAYLCFLVTINWKCGDILLKKSRVEQFFYAPGN